MSRNGRGRKRTFDEDNGWAERGGYMAAKLSKLDEQFKMDAPREKQKEGASTNIFSGVAIYVDGYTDPGVDQLRRLMMLHGGQFHVYYSRCKTTHIVATNLPNSKIQELRGEKVVRPEWITDSIKAGHLLSYLQYQLYAKQKGLSFPSVCVRQTSETAAGPSLGPPQSSHISPHPSLGPPPSSHISPHPSLGQPPSSHISPHPSLGPPPSSHISPHPSRGPPPSGFHGPPLPSHDQPLPHHHNPLPSHSPLYPGLTHPHLYSHPGQNNPLADLFTPQLSLPPPGPPSSHPNLYSPFPSHLHSVSDPGLPAHPPGLGQPPPGCIRSPSAYTPPQPGRQSAQPGRERSEPGQAPPQPDLSSSHHRHNYRELDFRLNGSLRGSCDQTGPPKVNGLQEGGGREDLPCPLRPPRRAKDPQPPVTNGHIHPVNGALKPLDLSPTSTRATSNPPGPDHAASGQVSDRPAADRALSRLQRPPCWIQSPERKSPGVSGPPPPPSPPPRLAKPDPPSRPPDSPPKRPTPPLPAETHPSGGNEPQQQRPKPPPPTYEEAIAAAAASESRPHRQKPGQSVSGLDETHSPFASPAPSPVRLNGGHHSAFPASPAPPEGQNQSAARPPVQAGGGPAGGGIISEYYSHSRLHHISTWRNEFSEYVNVLQSRRRAAGGATFPGKDRLRRSAAHRSATGSSAAPSMQSCILHVDMDCFFVSVGIRHRPDLKGKPVAVTSNRGVGRVAQRPGANAAMEQQYYQSKHTYPRPEREDEDLDLNTPEPDSPVSHGNGVDQDVATLSRAEIASCSYEARQAGVRNGMFFGQAKQLCPSLQSVPYDFQAYKEVALAMYETLASYTHDIEALSCDEALMDGSALMAELGVAPDELASAIRADVKERTGCCASVGMASNILLARMAIRKAKPDGQHLLRSEEVDDFLREQSVTSLPGVGRSMGGKLASLGVRSCGDLQQVTLSRLQKEFGPRTGQTLYRFCRGLDDRPVRSEKERKSVSAEMNYNIRFTQVEEAESFLTNFSMEVQRRLQGAGLRGRRVTLKVMVRKPGAPVEPAKYGGHGICDNLARSVTMAQATDSGQLIASEVIKLFHAMRLEVQDMRGVGLQVQLLEGVNPTPQDAAGPRSRSIKEMFLGQQAKPNSKESLHVASDAETTANQEKASSARVPPPCPSPGPSSPAEAIPVTSKGEPPHPTRTPNHAHAHAHAHGHAHARTRLNLSIEVPSPSQVRQRSHHTPNHAHARTRLNLSIEVPSPSQVDRSVLEALPAELREQVEQSWTHRDRRISNNNNSLHRSLSPPHPSSPPPRPSSPPPLSYSPSSSPPPPPPRAPPVGTLVLQIPNQPGQSGSTGIILELPDFSQVDPEVFAALPRELQEELRSAYNRRGNAPPQGIVAEHRNPLLQLKQLGVGVTVGRVKRRYKKKNAGSPAKKGPSPLKRPRPGSSPVKALPHALRARETPSGLKTENTPSTSSLKQDVPEELSKFIPRPSPALAGACDFTDIRTLLREWVTTISEPMEEDILQVVKYCTDLIEDKDLEKLDLVIKYMKRLMQQSVESVWSMAFDFILDNVQMVVQQAYGSMLKII